MPYGMAFPTFGDQVVHLDWLWLPRGEPFSTGILVVSDQLLLLGVDGNHRLSLPRAGFGHGVDVLELGVSIRVVGALSGLEVGLQTEAQAAQQAADQLRPAVKPRSASAADRRRWSSPTHNKAASGSPRIDRTNSFKASNSPGWVRPPACRHLPPDVPYRPNRRRPLADRPGHDRSCCVQYRSPATPLPPRHVQPRALRSQQTGDVVEERRQRIEAGRDRTEFIIYEG